MTGRTSSILNGYRCARGLIALDSHLSARSLRCDPFTHFFLTSAAKILLKDRLHLIRFISCSRPAHLADQNDFKVRLLLGLASNVLYHLRRLTGRLFIGDIVNSNLRQFQLTFDTNFWGPVRVLQAALPLMPTTGERASSLPFDGPRNQPEGNV